MSRPTRPTYKTRNWPAYNEALKRRGSLTIWFDPAMIWEAAPTGKRGRQPDYSGEYPSCARAFWHPEPVSLDQRIGGFKELSHDCDDGDFCWFPSVAELSVFGLQFGIEAHGHERRHVERVA